MEFIAVAAVVGILILGRVFKERIEGHQVTIFALLAGAAWMAYEWTTGTRGAALLMLIYLYGAWYHWKARREGRWTAFSVRGDRKS